MTTKTKRMIVECGMADVARMNMAQWVTTTWGWFALIAFFGCEYAPEDSALYAINMLVASICCMRAWRGKIKTKQYIQNE